LVLVNKKNIYTVFVKNLKEVIFQEMLQAPVEIEGPRQNVSVWGKEGST
jgi:hypothetical protein